MPARDFYVPLHTPSLGGPLSMEREKFHKGGMGGHRKFRLLKEQKFLLLDEGTK